MKKDTRLNNVIFPVWFLIFYPLTWLAVLPANFAVDTLVLLVACLCMKLPFGATWKRSIWLVWAFGFAADLIGATVLLIGTILPFEWWEQNIGGPISYQPFNNVWAVLFTLFAMAVSSALIYFFDRFIAFARLGLETAQVKRLALVFAIATTPITFLVPSAWFYSGY